MCNDAAPSEGRSSAGSRNFTGPALGNTQRGFTYPSCRDNEASSLPLADQSTGRFLHMVDLWLLPHSELRLRREGHSGKATRMFYGKWQETEIVVKQQILRHDKAADKDWRGKDGLMDENEGQRDAFSVLNAPSNAALHLDWLEQEVSILMSLRHPSIVTLVGVCLSPPCVITARCARGNLEDLLARARGDARLGGRLTWTRRLMMIFEIAKGFLHLHGHFPPIIHRDLKTSAILVDQGWHCKISNFSLAHREGFPAYDLTCAPDNSRWLAPEVMSGEAHTKESDVYAFSVVMWQLLMWEIPWGAATPVQIVMAILVRNERLPIPQDLGNIPGGTFYGIEQYIDLMKRCWASPASKRPSFQIVVNELRQLLEHSVIFEFEGNSPLATR